MSIEAIRRRYDVSLADANKLNIRLYQLYVMDWSAMSWAQIDKRFKSVAKDLGIKLKVLKHETSFNA